MTDGTNPWLALIVEDAPELVIYMTSLVRHAGFEVITASRGETALTLAREQRPGLVCLDLMLPTMSGLEVCEKLRAEPGMEHALVIITSARRDPQDRAQAELAGADAYIVKPVEPDTFATELRRLLRLRREVGAA